ncbi:hypothetical protein GYA19_04095 [Candidatus Beckwithbacteria bacterium]|nr:hypothetical protein [Candidatus Beckwithbacteria bacterium]
MTLIVNEIHILDGFRNTFQLAIADRRITRNGKFDSNRKKILPIPYLKATVSYFGLASFIKNSKEIYLTDWLLLFIRNNSTINNLKDFSNRLCQLLNKEIDKEILNRNISGFHISGYNNQGFPEFWHFSNINAMVGWNYGNVLPQYNQPTSDFLERDAINLFGWNGQNCDTNKNAIQFYRNGDIRTHVLAFEEIDKFMLQIFKLSDFNKLNNEEDYANYVKFKFELISLIYTNWAKNKIIGKPIDVYIFKKDYLKKL